MNLIIEACTKCGTFYKEAPPETTHAAQGLCFACWFEAEKLRRLRAAAAKDEREDCARFLDELAAQGGVFAPTFKLAARGLRKKRLVTTKKRR